jgi:2-dehydro-3-deoxyphosphogluconate aldolase/(4S)-4-hydroxy-2-oxoglutarate aldolase
MSRSVDTVVANLRQCRIVPVVTLDEPDTALDVAAALLVGGISCIEITFRRPGAADAIRAAREVEGMMVGAGTVLTTGQVDAAVAAHADFAVAPASNDRVIWYCQELELPFFPGVATASEIDHAAGLGLDAVKVFPAAQVGGPAFVKAVAATYPDMGFIPTGGVTPENLPTYLELPSVIACGGSWLVPPELVANGDYDRITELASAASAAAATVERT